MLKKIILGLVCMGLSCGFLGEVKASGGSVDMTSTNFMIDTSNFTVSDNKMIKGTATETVNTVLGTMIKKFLIGLGIVSLAVMSIGAGYMIMPYATDELNTKGKTMFKMAVISLIVALSAYYIVNLVAYFLYEDTGDEKKDTFLENRV